MRAQTAKFSTVRYQFKFTYSGLQNAERGRSEENWKRKNGNQIFVNLVTWFRILGTQNAFGESVMVSNNSLLQDKRLKNSLCTSKFSNATLINGHLIVFTAPYALAFSHVHWVLRISSQKCPYFKLKLVKF